MALVFQYGSNLSTVRLNGADRLKGGAQVVGVARTMAKYHLAFTAWSEHNLCAAADLVADEGGRSIYGVLYEIPDDLVFGYHPQMTLDRIEGEGHVYCRQWIAVMVDDNASAPLEAWTYQVMTPKWNLFTEIDYVRHLFIGMKEHGFPDEYQQYVMVRVLRNHPALQAALDILLASLEDSCAGLSR